MKQVALTVGQTFVFELDSNPATGYSWIVTNSEGLNVSEEFRETEEGPGKQLFMIHADEPGEYVFEVQYRKPDDDLAVDGLIAEVTVTSA
jgi:predicted secreted protein